METPLLIVPDDPVGLTAQGLIGELCHELSNRYGSPPSPFSAAAEAATSRTVFLVARIGEIAVGCGAIRRLDDCTAEVKRMYVARTGRRTGIARRILAELERYARDFGYQLIRLETGILQPEAQRLYESSGHERIPTFGPYVESTTSVCYQKAVRARDDGAEPSG